jgi:hypothetical protein
LHPGDEQTLEPQRDVMQSVPATHFFPVAHAGQSPPQSVSVSAPFWKPSVHVGA